MDHRHWPFCEQKLQEVSRTFSIPISMLRPHLRTAVTCGYLLCRIADTVEDDATLSLKQQDALYADFLRAVETGEGADAFELRFASLSGFPRDGAEFELAAHLGRVLEVLYDLPEALVQAVTPWVCEMTRGMSLYNHRPLDDEGLHSLRDLADLERYCYYVAGTVGHLLTEVFIAELGLDGERSRALRTEAEEFGLGLQLVNILKDVTDDAERKWSFVPRSLFAAEGMGVREAMAPERRAQAWRAIDPVFDRAAKALEGAFRYVLALPSDASDVRMFCLLPLWMAVRTWGLARGDDRVFEPGEAVKITRDEVEHLVADCLRVQQDDAAMTESFRNLWPAMSA